MAVEREKDVTETPDSSAKEREFTTVWDALSEGEERLRTFSRVSLEGIALLDAGKIVDSNEALATLFGCVHGNVTGRPVTDFIAAEHRGPFMKYLESAREQPYEALCLRENGATFAAEIRIMNIPLRGRPVKAAVIRDISRRKATEEALRRSEEQYRLLFESNPHPMMVYNVETLALISVNDAAVNLYGYPRDEFLSLTVKDIRPPEDVPALLRHLSLRNPSFQKSGEWRHRKKDGAIIHVEVSAHDLTFMGSPARFVLINDITERKIAEEALSRRDSILEAVSFAAGEFLRILSWDDSIRKVLEMLGKATGVSRVHVFEQTRGTGDVPRVSLLQEWTAHGIVPHRYNPELQAFAWQAKGFTRWADILSKGEILYGHTRVFPPAEQNILIQQHIRSIAVVPIFVAHDLWGFIGFDDCDAERDWSLAEIGALRAAAGIIGAAIQRKAAREALERSEHLLRLSLREKETLLKEIHHRVKNNLQVISSLLSLQSSSIRDTAVTEAFRESRNRIRSLAMIHEKLYRSAGIERIDMAEYIRDLVSYLVNTYNMRTERMRLTVSVADIHFEIDTAIPCGLILNELVSNALKHAFTKERDRNFGIRIILSRHGGGYRLVVGDNGAGLPAGLNYRKTDSLGLQLVTTLVQQLSGRISLRRRGGTTFTIDFAEARIHSPAGEGS